IPAGGKLRGTSTATLMVSPVQSPNLSPDPTPAATSGPIYCSMLSTALDMGGKILAKSGMVTTTAFIFVAGMQAAPVSADTLTYTNGRFGFQITLPAGTAADGETMRTLDWRLTGSGDATDGAVFEADDGHIELLAFGQQFWQDSWQQVYQMAAQALKEDGSTITYQRITDKWFVYSGKTKTGDTYYQRTQRAQNCLKDPITITATLTYADSDKWIGSLIVPLMASLEGC
ncbi:hypothetical protein, partial [Stakelama marina]